VQTMIANKDGVVAAGVEVLNLASAFRQAVRRHDITFEYADDGTAWRQGCESLDNLKRLARKLPLAYVKEVFNAHVDSQLAPDHREQFYWQDHWSR
jgi:hypothetical protein